MAFVTGQKFTSRIKQLVKDGFLAPHSKNEGDLIITELGLAVLLACADRPMPKERLQRIMLTHEEREALITNRYLRARRLNKPRDNLEGKDREDA